MRQIQVQHATQSAAELCRQRPSQSIFRQVEDFQLRKVWGKHAKRAVKSKTGQAEST
jgi:hypothetical protein